jgi:Fanconi-associated nuclease 1
MTTYSPEIGEQGVKAAARTLSHEISIPADLLRDEPNAEPDASSRLPVTPGVPARSYPTPESSKDAKKRLEGRKLPWADLPTGLTPEEERSDPDLAAAIRESMWASRVGRVELDEDGTVVDSPPPERATPSRSVSGSSTSSTTAQPSRPVQYDEVFSLEPKQPRPVVTLANSERNMTLEDIMSCVSADELKKLARARKVPTAGLINRQSTVDALKALASKQTTLGFTPVKGKSKDTQATLPFTPKRTTNSEDLLIKSLMPLLGHGAVQLTPELHSLIGRVNLIFSRTPPLTATSSSLMLPSILVTSHKRRYPEYGPPTRSKIWQSRDELLIWERAVHWESVVGDAMGDSWAEMRKNPLPRMGMRTEMLGRVEGAKVVKRIWEGIWPVWQELVAGEGGKSVDPTKEDGGLVGDRFKTGKSIMRSN